MKHAVLFLIRLYQRTKFLFFIEKSCRFEPRCSQYMYQAVNRYGIIYGSFLGLRRIIRCHPWNKGGYDPLYV